jgi:hypothetical protein
MELLADVERGLKVDMALRERGPLARPAFRVESSIPDVPLETKSPLVGLDNEQLKTVVLSVGIPQRERLDEGSCSAAQLPFCVIGSYVFMAAKKKVRRSLDGPLEFLGVPGV